MAVAEAIGRIRAWDFEVGEADSTPAATHGYSSTLGWFTSPQDATPILDVDSPGVFNRTTHLYRGYKTYFPWKFEPFEEQVAFVSSTGLGSVSAGIVLVQPGAGKVIDATEFVPVASAWYLINPAQITVETTPLLEESASLRMVTPGLATRVLRLADFGPGQELVDRLDPRASAAVSAAKELGRWLGRSDDEVADICRYSLRSARYWARGTVPKPATVRRLFETHALVSSLVRRLGTAQARHWLEEPTSEGKTRLQVLAREGGMSSILRQAAEVLFAGEPSREKPRPESDETAEAMSVAGPYEPGRFSRGARRPRKPGIDGD